MTEQFVGDIGERIGRCSETCGEGGGLCENVGLVSVASVYFSTSPSVYWLLGLLAVTRCYLLGICKLILVSYMQNI